MRITKPPEYSLEQYDEYRRLLYSENARGFYDFCMELSMEEHIALFNSFSSGQKVSGKEKARNLMERGYEEYHDKQR